MADVVEITTEKGIVRFHAGKLSEEERRVVIEKAAREFYQTLMKKGYRINELRKN